MSLSLPKTEVPTVAEQPRWQRRNLSPGRGLIVLAALAVVLSNFHFFWEAFVHAIIIVLEIGEETLDILLEEVGLGAGAAQMVTAYTGLGLAVFGLVVGIRKIPVWIGQFAALLRDYREMYVHVFLTLLATVRLELAAWWGSLDGLGKFIAGVVGLVVGVPAALLLSWGLGLLVSLLF